MAEYIDNAKVIKETLAKAMAAATPAETKSLLNTFVIQLDSYLLKLETFYQQIEVAVRQAEMQYANVEDVSDLTISYSTYKKIKYSDAEIDILLKTGYVLMDDIRSLLTKEEITYQIGTSYRGQLFETRIGIEELLKFTRVEYNTRSKLNNMFKLRMYNKGELRQSMNRIETILDNANDDSSTIWSTVNEFVKARKSDSAYKNKGNAYEVYRVLVGRNHNHNWIPPAIQPTEKEIEDTFSAIRSNTASSVKGGDYLSDQIKYFSSAPSIVTTSLVRTTLTEVRNVFKQYIAGMDSGSFQSALTQMFIKDKDLSATVDAAENEARDLAEEELIKAVKSLNLTIN